jgi:ABC-2 type transport system ATP-binding protein
VTSERKLTTMIEVSNLTKRYGHTVAVDHLSFQVRAGRVTGFLGPNGAGKSTTLRLILGLDLPSEGTATVNHRPFAEHRRPLFEVGAMLEAKPIHPGRSAYNHLLALAQSNGIGRRRVGEVVELVGLDSVVRKRAGGFSLGMGQRLGIAAALLGDPGVLILDEPVNGLDPEGILWIRNLLRALAAEGRTILVSSHLMSEMALTADDLIVIGRGRLIAQSTVAEFIEASSHNFVRLRSPMRNHLGQLLQAEGASVSVDSEGALAVTGTTAEAIGELAAAHGVVLYELSQQHASLEEAFMELTGDSVEYRADRADSHPHQNWAQEVA